jgi:hypothetical protein
MTAIERPFLRVVNAIDPSMPPKLRLVGKRPAECERGAAVSSKEKIS